MQSVIGSVNSQHCFNIFNGIKTVDVRKSKPKMPTPFRCFIYCTKASPYLNRHNGTCYLEKKDILGGRGTGYYERLNGKIIGEYVCDDINDYECSSMAHTILSNNGSCMTKDEILKYCKGKKISGWHISNPKIYDTPKELTSEYVRVRLDIDGATGLLYTMPLPYPPLSWCYAVAINK